MDDYKEKYEDILDLAKKMYDAGTYDAQTIERLFPELKCTADERIRKALISCVNKIFEEYSVFEHTTKENILAWINKQEHIDWSEYDERNYTDLRIFIQCFVEDERIINRWLNWLESLRPKSNWKPSDDQLSVVKHVVEHVPLSVTDKNDMYSLYVDLQKLI